MKVLVIGLDGATFDQLSPWIAKGYMPALQQIVQQGARSRLNSTVPPITAPAWSTFATGLNPGRHGVFGFLRPVDGKPHERALNDSRDIRGARFWNVLNHVDRRVGVVDLPMFFPPEKLEGFMVSDVITSGWKKAQTYPDGLKAELELVLPELNSVLGGALLDGVNCSHAYLDRLILSLEAKERLDLHLISSQSWDVLVTVYPHTDVFQHHFWQILDPEHPWFDSRVAGQLAPQVERFIHRLDTTVSRLVEASGDATVVLASDHGFGPVKRVIYVNALLLSLKYLFFCTGTRRRARLTPTAIKKWAIKLDVLGLRSIISKRLRQQIREGLRTALVPEMDWSRTLAYFEMNNDQGVWINRKTPFNPHGPAMSDGDYQAIRAQLIADLRQAVDPETGRLLFESVHPREDAFIGPYVDRAPDVMFQPSYGYMTSSDFSGQIVGHQPRGLVSGYHRPDGIFIVWGSNIQAGEFGEAQIEDVAPTILYLAGAPVPQGLDGRVLDVVTPAYRELHPVTYVDAAELPQRESTVGEAYSEQDEEAVLERLRGLGYL